MIIIGVIFFLLAGQALALEKDYEIAITKGAYSIDKGEYEAAIEYLNAALNEKPGDLNATLSLGIAYSRLGDYEKAKDVLQKALSIDPYNERARYELGVVLFKMGERDSADDQFLALRDRSSDEDLRKGASTFIELSASSRQDDEKKYSLGIIIGGQFDTNTILEPSNPDIDRGTEEDWRAIAAVNAGWKVMRKDNMTLDAEYVFYQSLHGDNTDFDLQQHSASISGNYTTKNGMEIGLEYTAGYSLASGDEYSMVHGPSLELGRSFYEGSLTALSYAHEFRDYYDSSVFPTNSSRSGNYDAIGITHSVETKDTMIVSISYMFDIDAAKESYWESNGHNLSVSLDAQVNKWMFLMKASYSDRQYQGDDPAEGEKRHDQVQQYSANVVWAFHKAYNISLSELYVINSSNVQRFDYDRSITGLYLMVRL
ncbi:MAG: bacterial transcriptional activator domain-containing protein [Nitrospirota bacterium]|nr:MAG: bacterial transcriptional activator domain-containing protein [Nitrospirota bacterium]